MTNDRDAHIWAARIAEAYLEQAGKPFTLGLEAWLARSLVPSVTRCVQGALQGDKWGPEHVNLAIARWEYINRSEVGPRLVNVDYIDGSVIMSR